MGKSLKFLLAIVGFLTVETALIESRNQDARLRDTNEFSFPRTKWCGPGNTADGYDDLGDDSEVDKCCRQHDHCDNIASGEEKHGLTNTDMFTRLNCRCDNEFRRCLKTVNSKSGNYIGNFYFNFRNLCYEEQFPAIECEKTQFKIFLQRCVEYKLDTTKPKVWQWFDMPFYDFADQFENSEPHSSFNLLETN